MTALDVAIDAALVRLMELLSDPFTHDALERIQAIEIARELRRLWDRKQRGEVTP